MLQCAAVCCNECEAKDSFRSFPSAFTSNSLYPPLSFPPSHIGLQLSLCGENNSLSFFPTLPHSPPTPSILFEKERADLAGCRNVLPCVAVCCSFRSLPNSSPTLPLSISLFLAPVGGEFCWRRIWELEYMGWRRIWEKAKEKERLGEKERESRSLSPTLANVGQSVKISNLNLPH